MSSSCKRPGLATLPPELVASIVDHLTLRHQVGLAETLHHSPRIFELQAKSRTSSDCVSAISRTCSRLHHIVTPILYRAPLLLASRQVRALAQTISSFSSQSRPASLAPAPYIRGLLITPFDGYLSSDETLKDSFAWGPALQAILHSEVARELQMLSIVTSSQGPALRTLCNPQTKGKPRIVFINHLSSTAKPLSRHADLDFSVFSQVTHLHLSQMVLTEEVLDDFPSLTHLRLAGLPHQALTTFSAIHASHDPDSPSQSPEPPARRRSITSSDAATMLLALIRALARLPHMQLLQLELARLSALDPPSNQRAAAAGDGAPFEQFAAPGQLATIDFPADVPMDAAEAHRWAAEDERSRTAERDAHWMQVRDALEDVRSFAREVRKDCEARDEQGDSSSSANETCTARDEPQMQINVVGARPAGWSDAEACVDFLAHASALWTGEAAEGSADRSPDPAGIWADEDVFHLAATRPWLAYAREGEEVGAEADGENDRREPKEWRYLDDGSWWTGELPRVDAGPWGHDLSPQ